MSSAAFKTLAKSLLDEEDSNLMECLYLDPEPREAGAGDEGPSYAGHALSTGCDFIDHWREWERVLRLNVAKHRSTKIKRESGAPVEPPVFPADAVSAAVKAVVGTESPLDAEILIDRARWNAIEILAGSDNFNRNAVFAYFLKLVLLERRASFNTEEGFAEYKSLYASILENAQHSVGELK
jgi:hypothetical protein